MRWAFLISAQVYDTAGLCEMGIGLGQTRRYNYLDTAPIMLIFRCQVKSNVGLFGPDTRCIDVAAKYLYYYSNSCPMESKLIHQLHTRASRASSIVYSNSIASNNRWILWFAVTRNSEESESPSLSTQTAGLESSPRHRATVHGL